MKILIELEIKKCLECPFTKRVIEHGYSAINCSKLGTYSEVPIEGFRKDCPFREERDNKTLT